MPPGAIALPGDFADHDDHDDPTEPLPPLVGADERRMQVRAYNFWAGMLGDTPLPRVAPLLAGEWPDFASHSVLLHFEDGIDDPVIDFVGRTLRDDCGGDAPLRRLSDVPGRSILSRITDHYLQIVANEAPIGFEAEFLNQRDCTILYRGILLPFSSNGRTLDYIYGVINWKELADQATTNGLIAEIGLALGSGTARTGGKAKRKGAGHVPALPMPAFADHEEDHAIADGEGWGTLAHSLGHWADGPAQARDAASDDDGADGSAEPLLAPLGLPELDLAELDLADLDVQILPAGEPPSAEPASLADWLAAARALAAAPDYDDRTRPALHSALGSAWDFALAAEAEPDDYAALLAEAGISAPAGAPMVAVAKLVFGAGHDKTRLAEYATVLAHAHRLGLSRGELPAVLAQTPGGLKGVVAAERRLRRTEDGAARPDPRATLEAALRVLPARTLADLPVHGPEFTLVMVRRLPGGGLAVLGEVVDEEPLLERAARRLMP